MVILFSFKSRRLYKVSQLEVTEVSDLTFSTSCTAHITGEIFNKKDTLIMEK